MVRCPKCGKDNPDKQRFCFWCKAGLPEAEVPAIGGYEYIEVRAGAQPSEKPSKGPGIPWVKIIAVLSVVALVGAGAYLLISRKGDEGAGGGEGTQQQAGPPPAYPGASPLGTATGLSGGWSAKPYSTSASASTIKSWYATQMSGWTKVVDTTRNVSYLGQSHTVHIIAYTKGDDAMVAQIIESTSYGNMLWLMYGPKAGLSEIITLAETGL